jgi:ribonuclease VapC
VILDTSAIVAILLEEPDIEALLAKLGRAASRSVSSPILLECAMVLTGRLEEDAEVALSEFLQEFAVTTVVFGDRHWREAATAFRRFGKGRHPAALNFGDCMAYASAKVAGQPLLCIGGRAEVRAPLPRREKKDRGLRCASARRCIVSSEQFRAYMPAGPGVNVSTILRRPCAIALRSRGVAFWFSVMALRIAAPPSWDCGPGRQLYVSPLDFRHGPLAARGGIHFCDPGRQVRRNSC